jgi:hypothetical protein
MKLTCKMSKTSFLFRFLKIAISPFALWYALVAFGAEVGKPSFRDDLMLALEKADRILLVEHSCWVDFLSEANATTKEPPRYEYRTVDLSESAKTVFIQGVRHLKPKRVAWTSACLFEDHHSIRFYERNMLKSTMKLCFKCSQVSWDGSKAGEPDGFMQVASSIFLAKGFELKKDWQEMAQKYAQENPKKAPEVK